MAVVVTLLGLCFFLFVYRQETGGVVRIDWPSLSDTAFLILHRVWVLSFSLIGFILFLWMLEFRWDWKTQPGSFRINYNAIVGLFGAWAAFYMAVMLSTGLDLLVKPYGVILSGLEVSAVVAFCLVLYNVTRTTASGRFQGIVKPLQEIVREMILGLVVLVILVNTFIAPPSALPAPLQVTTVAALVAAADYSLSWTMVNWHRLPTYYRAKTSSSNPPESRTIATEPNP